MKHTTLDEITQIMDIMAAKKDETAALRNIVAEIRTRYSTMTDSQLAEAIRDVRGMQKAIEDNEAWLAKAEQKVRDFFKPAAVA